MKLKRNNNGSALVIVVFLASLMSVMVAGILQVNTQELQLIRNQIGAAAAMATAEAGLEHAISELRADSSWETGFDNTAFNGGSYTVDVSGSAPDVTIESTGFTAQGYTVYIEANVTVGASGPPHDITVTAMRINE